MKPLGVDSESVLEFWFVDAARDPVAAAAREGVWFGASRETDALVRSHFLAAVEAAARDEFAAWAQEPRSALAQVILLDQFPRNIWRGTARAFAYDAMALRAARAAIAVGHLWRLAPLEQAFLILPFEHSEAIDDQRVCVSLSAEIEARAPVEWRPSLARFSVFAVQHLEIIARFARFPHRNVALGREATAEETAYLDAGAEGFGQGRGKRASTEADLDDGR